MLRIHSTEDTTLNHREMFLQNQANVWDDQFAALAKCAQNHPNEVRFVIENWDILDSMTFSPLSYKGGVADTLAKFIGTTLPYNLLDAMWWVGFFVSHEIHDDGDPAIVWIKRDANLLTEDGPYEDPKLKAFWRCIHAPWNWAEPHEEGALCILISDPMGELHPHAKSICPTMDGSVDPHFVAAVTAMKTQREKRNTTLARIRADDMPKESEIQAALKDMLNSMI